MELSKKVITILSSLFEDLKLESGSEEDEEDIKANDMTIEVQVSAWQRIKQLLNHIPFVPLLLKLFSHSYSKVGRIFITLCMQLLYLYSTTTRRLRWLSRLSDVLPPLRSWARALYRASDRTWKEFVNTAEIRRFSRVSTHREI